MQPDCRAHSPGAGRSRQSASPHVDLSESDVDGLGVTLARDLWVAGYPDRVTCGGGPHCSGSPTPSRGQGDDIRSAESRSQGTLVEVSQYPVHRSHSPPASAPVFEHAQSHMSYALIHLVGKNRIAIMDQKPVSVIDRNRLSELL
jgi:hypothetical protein